MSFWHTLTCVLCAIPHVETVVAYDIRIRGYSVYGHSVRGHGVQRLESTVAGLTRWLCDVCCSDVNTVLMCDVVVEHSDA